jgi:hypothetical protein
VGTADGSIVGTTKVVDHGPDADKWNLVVLGDGFRAADQAAYTAAVTALVTTLQATAPFDGAWDRINVHRVDVHSTDAGADNPTTCGDGSAPAGGTAVTANTYFDAKFCNSGIRRLLVPDQALAVTTANAQVSGWDAILMVVNSTEYGGSGGQLATYSLAASAIEIALHEMGHAAFGLADEYEYFAGCASGEAGHDTHAASEPTEPNVTVEKDRTKVKWQHLIAAATAVPTTSNTNCAQCDPQANPVAADTVGLFEGAHYCHCGAFRPTFDCRMRTIGQPFCKVCQEVIANKLRAGSKPSCFIATAVYASPDHADVAALRAWRDRRVAPHARGQRAMRAAATSYERLGPRLARHVAHRPRLAGALRRAVFAPLARLLRRRARTATRPPRA